MSRVVRRYVVAYDMQCPDCEVDIASPHGSLNWLRNEEQPKEITCPDCKGVFKIGKGWH